jgi:hypothetical protein
VGTESGPEVREEGTVSAHGWHVRTVRSFLLPNASRRWWMGGGDVDRYDDCAPVECCVDDNVFCAARCRGNQEGARSIMYV